AFLEAPIFILAPCTYGNYWYISFPNCTRMSRVLFIAIFACAFLGVKAQKVENVRAAASGEQIIITYDLSGTKPEQRFKVNLYSSHNNFAAPVFQVTGDLGENVSAGKGKHIAWNAKNEIANFKG